MRIFKNTWFDRFARKEGIKDSELRDMVNDVLEPDLAEANYGGGVYKVRAARSGEGKSGGYRVIVLFKSEFRTFFVYGFEKSDRANIGQGEVRGFKKSAGDRFAMTDRQIVDELKNRTLIEVLQEEESEI